MPITQQVSVELGMAGITYPLAAELTAGTTTPEKLLALGVPGPVAIELAKQINASTIATADHDKLAPLGITTQKVAAIKRGRS